MPVPLSKLCPPAEALATDADLLARFAAIRDEVAFTELVRRHGPVVYRVYRRLVPAHAEDAFQAVFLILACRVAAVRHPAAVGSWLVGAAGRVSRQMQKAERRRAEHERGAARDAPRAESAPDAGELARVLDAELARLPDELRDPLILCLISGRTHEQAASALGTSVRTLRRRLDRAKSVLRARLERRGIIPAVVTALVAGVGDATGAVPHALIRQTGSIVFQFLDDGATTTAAAVVAKGVMQSMAKLKVSALMATAAAVLVCIGVGLAQPEAPKAQPQTLTVPALGETPLKLDVAVPNVAPGSVHRSANFLVSAPTPVMARVIASEAEYHRRALAIKWLGAELPQWPQRCVIRYTPGLGGNAGATTFTYEKDKDGKSGMKSASMEIRGDFMAALNGNLPHEVTHTVLASYFGQPLPRWADEGLSVLSESDAEQFAHDVRVRELLNAGRGIRLKVLLTMGEYPKDMIVLYAQGHSLAAFLAGKSGAGMPMLKDIPYLDRLFRTPGADGHRRLIAFIQLGMEKNTAESWDKAAKTVYGYDSVDALQEDWMASLKTPPKKKGANEGPRPLKPATSDLIPPAELPVGPEPTEVPSGKDIGTKR